MTQTKLVALGKHNGVDIEMRSDLYINMTQLCSAYNKKFWRYQDNESSKDFKSGLAADLGVSESSLTFKGGPQGNIYAQLDIAIRCAGWLDAACALWLNTAVQAHIRQSQDKPKVMKVKAAPKATAYKSDDLPIDTNTRLEQAIERLTSLNIVHANAFSDFAAQTSGRITKIEQAIESLVTPAPQDIRTRQSKSKPKPDVPRKEYLSQPVPEEYPLPVDMPYEGTRNTVTSIVGWAALRWAIHPQDLFDALYFALSNELGIDLKYHAHTWYQPTYNGAIIDFIVEKGYGVEAVLLAYSMWGNGQRPVPVALDHKKASRVKNMEPVGPRAGMDYIYHVDRRPAKGYRRRPNQRVDMVSARAQQAVNLNRQRKTMADRLDAFPEESLSHADSAEAKLAALNATNKTVASTEPFIAAQQR